MVIQYEVKSRSGQELVHVENIGSTHPESDCDTPTLNLIAVSVYDTMPIHLLSMQVETYNKIKYLTMLTCIYSENNEIPHPVARAWPPGTNEE